MDTASRTIRITDTLTVPPMCPPTGPLASVAEVADGVVIITGVAVTGMEATEKAVAIETAADMEGMAAVTATDRHPDRHCAATAIDAQPLNSR